MKFNQRRHVAHVALFSLMALGAGSAFAQTERPAPGLPSPSSGPAGLLISPAQFSSSLQARERELASIEQLFTRIEAAKLPAEKEKLSEGLSAPLDAYAKGMIESINTALKQAELAAKSQGKEGSTGLLKPFEDLAVKHEQRMKQLDVRAKKIGSEIEKEKSSSIADPKDGAKVARGWPLMEKVSDFLIPPAHAALAIPTVGVCGPLTVASVGTAFVACLAIIGTTIPLIATAVNQFSTCWSQAHNHRVRKGDGHYHNADLMRVTCATILIVKLA